MGKVVVINNKMFITARTKFKVTPRWMMDVYFSNGPTPNDWYRPHRIYNYPRKKGKRIIIRIRHYKK